jgi:hypothetical protein
LYKELGLNLELSHFKGVRIYTIMVEDYSAGYSYRNKKGIEIICGDSKVAFFKRSYIGPDSFLNILRSLLPWSFLDSHSLAN